MVTLYFELQSTFGISFVVPLVLPIWWHKDANKSLIFDDCDVVPRKRAIVWQFGLQDFVRLTSLAIMEVFPLPGCPQSTMGFLKLNRIHFSAVYHEEYVGFKIVIYWESTLWLLLISFQPFHSRQTELYIKYLPGHFLFTYTGNNKYLTCIYHI